MLRMWCDALSLNQQGMVPVLVVFEQSHDSQDNSICLLSFRFWGLSSDDLVAGTSKAAICPLA